LTDSTDKLHHYFDDALKVNSEKTFIKSAVGHLTYGQINRLALEFQKIISSFPIQENDRIIIYSSKKYTSIAMMIACSRCNLIYVPVSSANPIPRAKYIIDETSPAFVLCDDVTAIELEKTYPELNLVLASDGIKLYSLNNSSRIIYNKSDAAFILFTSGSTGTPKGVVISHSAAIVFIDWAAQEFNISGEDIIASIAPFNFDLSVFDIYVTIKRSGTLLLFTEDETKNALLIAQKLSQEKATTIYATPTFYSTLVNYGRLHKYDYSTLKNILFAGEVFHMENFDSLLQHWPDKNYANLYGPTETNVCTFFKVDVDNRNYSVFPIGKSCSYSYLLLQDDNGEEINEKNIKGELLVAGRSLFNGYWIDKTRTEATTIEENDNLKYYKTGDIVYKDDQDDFVYVTRKDRMIKKNGFRIEPSEIEKVMMSYPNVTNTAVIFSQEKNQLTCYLEKNESAGDDLINLKNFCLQYLPQYMIPDNFIFIKTMPQTSSGKIDLQSLIKQYL
jgi:amino acid adenylation domain-containing protein